jgi:hypothetical protein
MLWNSAHGDSSPADLNPGSGNLLLSLLNDHKSFNCILVERDRSARHNWLQHLSHQLNVGLVSTGVACLVSFFDILYIFFDICQAKIQREPIKGNESQPVKSKPKQSTEIVPTSAQQTSDVQSKKHRTVNNDVRNGPPAAKSPLSTPSTGTESSQDSQKVLDDSLAAARVQPLDSRVDGADLNGFILTDTQHQDDLFDEQEEFSQNTSSQQAAAKKKEELPAKRKRHNVVYNENANSGDEEQMLAAENYKGDNSDDDYSAKKIKSSTGSKGNGRQNRNK